MCMTLKYGKRAVRAEHARNGYTARAETPIDARHEAPADGR